MAANPVFSVTYCVKTSQPMASKADCLVPYVYSSASSDASVSARLAAANVSSMLRFPTPRQRCFEIASDAVPWLW